MRRSRGQGSSELMLVISVVTLTVVASASTLVPLFRSGVENLGRDVANILGSGSVGGIGGGGSSGGSVGSASGEDMRNAQDDYDEANDPMGEAKKAPDNPFPGNDEIGPPIDNGGNG